MALDRMKLRRILAGVATPNQQGGFFGGLQAGIGGALNQGALDEQQALAATKAQIEQDFRAREVAAREQSSQADWMRANAPPNLPANAGELDFLMNKLPQPLSQDEALGRVYPPRQESSGGELGYIMAHPEALATYRQMHPSAAAENMPGLSDEALEAAAQRYALTGAMPAMGMGKQAAAYRAEIMNRAGKSYPSANIAANLADYKKNAASLSNVQRIRDAASAWENTAGKNADVALSALSGVPDWGNRPLNRIIRFFASQAGSPEMAAFNAARETIKVEYARLLSSPGVANGVLSDAARKEVEGIISGDLTKPQLVRALQILKNDAHNRRVSYDVQIKEIQNRLQGNKIGTAASSYVGGQAAATVDPLDQFIGNPGGGQ